MKRLKNMSELLQNYTIHDFIVVGGGISGLQAAEIIAQQTKNFILLQAQSVVGGRIQTLSLHDEPIIKNIPWIQTVLSKHKDIHLQRGATWIEHGHKMMIKLCSLFGIKLIEQFTSGSSIYLLKSKAYTSKELIEHKTFGPEIKRVINVINCLAEQYDKELFQNLQKPTVKGIQLLQIYDKMTIAEFLKKQIPDQLELVRDIFDNFFEHTECISCSKCSMHEMLTKHARSNDLGILTEFFAGSYEHEPSYLVQGGTSTLITKFIHRIQHFLKTSSLHSVIKDRYQVLTIDSRNKNIAIVTAQNLQTKKIYQFRTKRVICAVPIAVCKQIIFTNISEAKKIIFDNQIQTGCIKSFLICKTPFWRKKATGDGLFSKDHCVNMCHDVSPNDGSCGIMVFFISGVKKDQWESGFQLNSKKQENLRKKEYIIEMMCKMYSVAETEKQTYFQDSVYYEATYMHNQYIRSGFQSSTRPKTFNLLLDIQENLSSFYRDENLLTFIGSEYSLRFASYIEGAIRSAREKTYRLVGKKDPLQLTNKEANQI